MNTIIQCYRKCVMDDGNIMFIDKDARHCPRTRDSWVQWVCVVYCCEVTQVVYVYTVYCSHQNILL